MSHKYPHPETGEKVLSSVTQIISDATDKSAPLSSWAANQVVEWIRKNCVAAVDYPENAARDWYKVWDEDLEQARTHFRDVSQEALDAGSETHHAIEDYLNALLAGKDIKEKIIRTLSGQAANAFGAFLAWADEHELTPIATERTVYGATDGYGWAGTLDLVCRLEGKKYVIDFKTSRACYQEYRYQVAAYRWAIGKDLFFTDHKGRPEGCGILRLDKETGEPEWKDTSKTYEKDLRVFQAMVRLYMERHPRIAKRCKVEP